MSQRLAKIETAISRRKTIEFSYYSMQRDEVSDRKVDPYHLVFRNGQFYLIGYSHERDDIRVFRLSRIRGKVSYATKAEHDFAPREDFDRRDYASRADWQMGEMAGSAKVFLRERICMARRAGLRRLRKGAQGRRSRTTRRAAAGSTRPITRPGACSCRGCSAGARTRSSWSRPTSRRTPPSAWSCCESGIAPTSTWPTRSSGRSPRATAGRARRTGARRR